MSVHASLRPSCRVLLAGLLGLAACSSSPGEDDSSDAGSEGETSAGETGETGETSTGETGETGEPPEPVTLTVIEAVVFYDGYAGIVDEPVPENMIRHSNDLYAIQLDDQTLAAIQNTLEMRVWIGALCDNYDRLGGVFLSLVPKGADSYDPAAVPRMEIARFITPFMNMNKQPKAVPYDFDLGAVVPILKDPALVENYDLWIELQVFGVPYAANTEVPGCADRNDVFQGALIFDSNSDSEAVEFDFVTPLATREAFNNYQDGASDAVGTTRKTIAFSLDADTEQTQLVLITSNHGANQGGEEYNRRDHFVYVDGDPVLSYKPGRESCEPFRMFNTQGNGIYGQVPRSDEEWQSFSNWCPGDVIDTRIIDLGAMAAGAHEFVIDVPDAQFVDGEGDIPLSLYLQGR